MTKLVPGSILEGFQDDKTSGVDLNNSTVVSRQNQLPITIIAPCDEIATQATKTRLSNNDKGLLDCKYKKTTAKFRGPCPSLCLTLHYNDLFLRQKKHQMALNDS